jgi:hypothetical protein
MHLSGTCPVNYLVCGRWEMCKGCALVFRPASSDLLYMEWKACSR